MAQNRTFEVLYPGVTKTPRKDITLDDRTVMLIGATVPLTAGEMMVGLGTAHYWGRRATSVAELGVSLPIWLQWGEPELQIAGAIAAVQPEAAVVSALLLPRHAVIQTDVYTRNPVTPWAKDDLVVTSLIDAPGMGEVAEAHQGRMGVYKYSHAAYLANSGAAEAGRPWGQVIEITTANYLIIEVF